MQNLQYQPAEAPEVVGTPRLSAVPAVCEIPSDPTLEEENLWDVWPYTWAATAWDLAQNRFHSFHTNLLEWHLARANRRKRDDFQAEFWQSWNNRNESEEQDLRLV